nr:MAG TPA: winged helix-turn-helix protein [Caudoviricetes sp.]
MSKQMSPIEKVVLSLIPISDERRVNIKDIVAQTRLSTRRVKKIIDQLINNYGIVIVGVRNGRTGYFIPVTDQARQEGVLPLKAQAIKEFKRVNKIQKGNLDEWKKYIGDVENEK